MYNVPRLPVRFLAENNDLLKSQEVISGGQAGKGTDWAEQDIPHADASPGVQPHYRAPDGREIGNKIFRRHPDGSLDIEAGKHVIIDAIHKVKDKGYLTELEKLVLSVCYPTLFHFVDSRLVNDLMKVQLKLAPFEVMMLTEAVANHLLQEAQYNAGNGGFPASHRRF